MRLERLTPASLIALPARSAWQPASVAPGCEDRHMTVISLLAVLAGIAIGALLGFFFARSRQAAAAADLAAQASAADERARAAHERAALVESQPSQRFHSPSPPPLAPTPPPFPPLP